MLRRVLVCLGVLGAAAGALPPGPAGPAARLDTASVPAAMQSGTLLHVTSPGRFVLAAHSASGAAIQLVDMLAGPGETNGAAGGRDGRVDPLLDVGTYKLRVFSAKGASGKIALSVTPYRDAAPVAEVPAPGVLFAAELGDGQQRAFWLVVPRSGEVRVAVTGRALEDVRLWRDGRDLVALTPETSLVEPVAGHPMTEFRLTGTVEPGTYLVTAYGGPPATWSDGDARTPLYLRSGVSDALQGNWAGGAIGGAGSELFEVPQRAVALRLDLPRAAQAELRVDDDVATIDRRSREPSTVLWLTAGKGPRIAGLRGAAGQAYQLRVIEALGQGSVSRPGHFWVAANTLGLGGDEVPPAMLLLRNGGGEHDRIVASTAPHIGPGLAWRAQFNVRGATDFPVQVDAGGALTLRGRGVALDHAFDPRRFYDLPSGLFWLAMAPEGGKRGVIDAIVGPPGLEPAVSAPLPADPVLPFGEQDVGFGQSLTLVAPEAPGAQAGLVARPSPVALAEGPLTATQRAGQALHVPVRLAPGATMAASVVGGAGAVNVTQARQADGSWLVEVPAPQVARTVVLRQMVRPVATREVPAPRPFARLPALRAGDPVFLDLADGQQRVFALHLAQGGLFQVETTGRMRTQGRIGSSFIPTVAEGEANGAGQNMLLQPWLRAGDYHISVTARQSRGHLGVQAVPAPLRPAPPLLAGGSVRATLAAGEGLAIPVSITAAGSYEFSLLGQGAGFSARLDDEEGWPLVVPGPFDNRRLDLQPGQYALLVTPGPTERRLVAALDSVPAPRVIAGHGPHALPIGDVVSATWREPPVGSSERTPDRYTLSLAGPAMVHVRLGSGMAGTLSGGAGAAPHFAETWDGKLAAGDWVLALCAEGRNDRLDYTVSVTTDEVQPGRPRDVDLPSHSTFAISSARVVTLTTTGLAPTRAVLRAADGTVLARAGARENDWNTAISLRLPSGSYGVDLAPGVPPSMSPVAPRGAPQPQQNGDADNGEGEPDGQASQTAPNEAGDGENDNGGGDQGASQGAARTTLHLDLPPDLAMATAPQTETSLAGAGVHLLSVPTPATGALLVAGAHGAGTTLLALERRATDGTWRTVTQARGAAPVAAVMGDGQAAAWRTAVWSLDGDAVPIVAGARVVDDAAADRMNMLAGLHAAAARLELPSPAVTRISGPADMQVAGWAGHGTLAPDGGVAVPQGSVMWLVGPSAGPVSATPDTDAVLTLDITAGAQAVLPGPAAEAGKLVVWRADSGDGQPALRADAHLGAVAPLSAALASAAAPVLINAGDAASMRVQVRRLELTLLPQRHVDAPLAARLERGQAMTVAADPARGDISISVSPGLAAFLEGPNGEAGVWAPVTPVTRLLPGADRIVIANLGEGTGFVSLAAVPHMGDWTLATGTVQKRFFGAAGSQALTADVPSGGRLAVAGAASIFVRDAAGHVLSGNNVRPAAGRADIVLTHDAGLNVLSLEAPGQPAWPSMTPVATQVPVTMKLGGAAMAFQLPDEGPVLLHATTTAPVLLGAGGEAPELFASGAEFHRAMTGMVVLRVFSPQDGPLSGTLSLSTEKLRPAGEGLGETVAVAPGGSAAFSFALARDGRVGLGVRAEPDTATVRLLDESGRVVGEGVAQLRDLKAGRYVMEARVPPDAPATLVRPALVGTVPKPNGPPPDIGADYLELAGLKPAGTP